MATDVCVICLLPNQHRGFGENNLQFRIICERCGIYEVRHPESSGFSLALNDGTRPIVAEWIYQQNRLGDAPLITFERIASISTKRRLTFSEKMRRLLIYLSQNGSTPLQGVDIQTLKIQAVLQQFDSDFIVVIAKYLEELGLLKIALPPGALRGHVGPVPARLTARGIMQAEEWGNTYPASTQGFVAMWFNEQMKPAWEKGLSPAITDAGYIPQRIDSKEHIGKICDEIIAEIRRSRFVVADYTGHRGGVYYEAGYASGRDIPVISTCRKSDMEGLHFDIRQYNCIDWETPEELKQRLQARIEAVIGEGPFKHRIGG
jgi:hypothetical protein